MDLAIKHITRYSYQQSPRMITQVMRLIPPQLPSQIVKQWQVHTPGEITPFIDSFGNASYFVESNNPGSEIVITVEGKVSTCSEVHSQPTVNSHLPVEIFLRASPLTYMDQALRNFANPFKQTLLTQPFDTLCWLAESIYRTLPFTLNITHSNSTAAEIFALQRGVCQDLSHVLIACCRYLNVPARYISGYLLTETPMQTVSHAWVECWIEGKGWVAMDVVNLTLCDDKYVVLAKGLDYLDACPIRGTRNGGTGELLETVVEVSII